MGSDDEDTILREKRKARERDNRNRHGTSGTRDRRGSRDRSSKDRGSKDRRSKDHYGTKDRDRTKDRSIDRHGSKDRQGSRDRYGTKDRDRSSRDRHDTKERRNSRDRYDSKDRHTSSEKSKERYGTTDRYGTSSKYGTEQRTGTSQRKKEDETRDLPKRNMVHECVYVTSGLIALFVVIAVAILHGFAWKHVGVSDDLYDELREDTWKTYDTMECLVEPQYIFWVWGVVYVLQALWIMYAIIFNFERTKSGRYLYMEAKIMPTSIFFTMIFAWCCTYAWVFLWNHFGYEIYSIACIAGAVLFSFMALVTSMLACRAAEPRMNYIEQASALVRVGLLIQNGIAGFATMCSIMTNFQLAILLRQEANTTMQTSCYSSYGLLFLYMVVYFIIDTCLSDRHAQCVVVPYILIIVTYIGAYFQVKNIEKDSDEKELLWILALVAAGSVGVMLIVKITVSIIRAGSRSIKDRREAKEKANTLQRKEKA